MTSFKMTNPVSTSGVNLVYAKKIFVQVGCSNVWALITKKEAGKVLACDGILHEWGDDGYHEDGTHHQYPILYITSGS